MTVDLQQMAYLSDDQLKELVHNASDEGRSFLQQASLASLAQEDSPDGFKAFYELVYGNVLPDHLYEFVCDIYDSKKRDRANLFFAFRGSWKTTTLTMLFTAFRIGHNPERANLVVQASDSSAKKSASAIAGIIEFNPGWKLVFPDVIPDKENAWGERGYEVKRTDISYPEWKKLNVTRKDPTLLGLGILSAELIGKHPDGVLILDDIHDEENTESEALKTKVITKGAGPVLTER